MRGHVRGHSGDPVLGHPGDRDPPHGRDRPLPRAPARPSASPARPCRRSARIDLTQDPPPRGRWLAPSLVAELEANLAAGEQSLLFLNRRGFAPLTLCRTCGHRFQCPNCTAWMVEHRLMHRLACHHCGHVMPPPAAVPRMRRGGQPGRLRPRGRAHRRRGRRAVPRRAHRDRHLATPSGRRPAPPSSSRRWRRRRSTSSSAPSWSPRAITSPT